MLSILRSDWGLNCGTKDLDMHLPKIFRVEAATAGKDARSMTFKERTWWLTLIQSRNRKQGRQQ
jgi:hypothetical protein